MAEKQLFVVFGATGAQGSSVVKALLKDGTFKVRGVTRNPCKKAANDLKELGAEIVTGDLDDAESVKSVLTGAYGVFLVTNFLEHFSKEREIKQGKLVADTSKSLGLKHVVFSGLDNVKKLTNGELEVPHYDSKGEVEEYFREIDVPMTSVRLPAYFENLLTHTKPQKAPDGDGYTIAIPMEDVPVRCMSVADLGPMVLSILKSQEQYIGKNINLHTDEVTTEEMATILSKHTGKKIRDAKISIEDYEKQNSAKYKAMANMFRFFKIKSDYNKELTWKLNPKSRTFDEWVKKNTDMLTAILS
ncbi:nmrA-like family domain-containing protein 1 [Protopterus annectens]|uniref:nmrA-like family domain-containing protein 1 n=1 Tax=Protopterus annectens TaxID=7888 RepID=UPI001CFB9A26|nr:nmrA-like family domain-containing protein 1 [Protopterus annectens]